MNPRSFSSNTPFQTQSCERSTRLAVAAEIYARFNEWSFSADVTAFFIGFSFAASLKSAVKWLQSLNSKWWWHELALVQEIGLEGTDEVTARDLLGFVVSDAEATAPSSFACEKQRYGAKESFQMAPNTQAAIPIVNNQPRYFLVGDARGPRNRITMKQQNQLLNAIQGNKAARIRDPDAVKRRQAGWRDWAEQQWSAEARDFQVKELPAIQEAFVALFNSPNNRGSVATELRTVLFQSNLIKKGDIMTADEPAVATSATLTATSANSTAATAVSTATATSTESTGAVLTATVTSTELSWPLSTATATSTESTVPVSTATSGVSTATSAVWTARPYRPW